LRSRSASRPGQVRATLILTFARVIRHPLVVSCTREGPRDLGHGRPAEEAPEYFGWIASLATTDLAASSALTRQQLVWNPTGPGLLTELRNMDYSVA
jgi:hypothetical protein